MSHDLVLVIISTNTFGIETYHKMHNSEGRIRNFSPTFYSKPLQKTHLIIETETGVAMTTRSDHVTSIARATS